MTAFSLRARLNLGANSRLALSLPQSSPLYPKRLDSFAPSPFSARASAIRSRTCGRQRLAFLAASATGGARKPNPSEGAEAATAAEPQMLPKFKPQVSPPGRAALIRHGAAQKRSTAPPSPRGRLRRCSKSKPLRGSRGGSAASRRFGLRVPCFTCKALFVRFLSPLRARQHPAGCFPSRSLCAGRCPPSPGDSPWL